MWRRSGGGGVHVDVCEEWGKEVSVDVRGDLWCVVLCKLRDVCVGVQILCFHRAPRPSNHHEEDRRPGETT